MTALILASASETRVRLLRAAGLGFEIKPAAIDEQAAKESLLAAGACAREIANGLAEMKARKISAAHPEALVIGADQILLFEDEIVSKSESLPDARGLLKRMAGKTHALISAVALAKAGAIIWRHAARAELTMRRFSDGFLDNYLAREGGGLLGSVGCYRLEGEGVQLFSAISGDYFTVLGLPLLPLLGALRELGAVPA